MAGTRTGRRQNGQVGITDGEIIVTNPRAGGRYAILYPPEDNIAILVNGEEIEERTEVKEEDIIDVIPLKLLDEARMRLKISANGLRAEIAVHPRITSHFYLKDTQPRTSIKPQVGKKEYQESVLTMADALAELKKSSIVYGIDEAALKEAVETADGQFKTIARGKKVQEGKDGYIEFLVNPETEAIVYGEEEQKVDYRERFRFPEVKKGDVIALVHPAQEGVPGYKVTGEAIQPKPVKNAAIRCIEGVDPGENESEIIVLKNGRLVVSGNRLKVVNLLIHDGDVDLESGNIRFNGDVHIYGNIQEGMMVEAEGDLFVEGNGYGATVKAGGSLQFSKNIIKCRVEGGLFFALLKKILPIMEKLIEQLDGIVTNAQAIVKAISQRGQEADKNTLAMITRSVMEKNPLNLQESITKLERLFSKYEAPKLSILQETLLLLKEIRFSATSPKELSIIKEKITVELQKLKEQRQDIPVFSASYIQNSDIDFGGKIVVTGPGSYLSNFKAGEEVNIHGVFRGGSIEASGNVKVKEFVVFTSAAESLARKSAIRIKVPSASTITFSKVHVDTTVQVGKFVYKFDKEQERVKVSYDNKDGILRVTGF